MLIASRTLTLRQSGRDRAVRIDLFAPVQDKDCGWFCRYEIAWPHARDVGEGWGLDAIQAIEITLRKIGSTIYASPYHESGRLMWREAQQGYGFPVPNGIRDLLIGEDALYL